MPDIPNVLIVDDHKDFLYHVAVTLDAAGYQSVTARDGAEALEMLRTYTIHLILADIAMPKLNGYQLHEVVREHPEWQDIPFVFLSARNLNSDIYYGLQLGADQYLTKPIHAGDLLTAVEQMLNSVPS